MKTLLRIIYCAMCLALGFLASCSTDYVQSVSGSRLFLGQVGGQKAIERITVDGITIEGYGVDNRESFKDAMDFAGTYAGLQAATKMLESDNATSLGKAKSADEVTTTGIKEGASTDRLINNNATKVNLAELGVE